MTNVESMDYTHSHPSTIASLSCAAQISPAPYTHHIPFSKQPPYLLLWHFHSHSEIYCHATFHHSVYYDTHHHCHIALHDHVVDIIFVAKPPFIIFIHVTLNSLHIPVHHQRHSHRVIFVLVSSCNFLSCK